MIFCRYFQSKLAGLILFVALMLILPGCDGGGTGEPGTGEEGLIKISGANPQQVSPVAYGQNYWDWVPSWTNSTPGTETLMADLHLNVYRGGGITPDIQNAPEKWDLSQVDKYIAYCRAINVEPMLQIPVATGNAAQAAYWVEYCNKTKGYQIKYWIIGNEPDLYDSSNYKPGYTVQDYINDFKAYAAAMKAVDDTIMVVGPELAFRYTPGDDWLTPFLEQCKTEVDIVSFHFYPFGKPGEFTIANVLNSDSITRSKIKAVCDTVKRYCPDKPIAMTETHVSWSGVMGKLASAESFYAGLWIAETMGISLQKNLWTTAFWCTSGGYGTGFIDYSTKKPRAAYYGLQMFSKYFGNRLIHPAETPKGISVYASRNTTDDRTIIIVVNKSNVHRPEIIQFVDFGAPLSERKYTFPAYSLTCLSIPDDGSAMECWSYTKAQHGRKEPPEYKVIQGLP